MASMALATATAAFNSSQDSVAVVWSTAFISTPSIASMGVVIGDSLGPVSVNIINPTNTGCTVETSARFTGAVELIASGT